MTRHRMMTWKHLCAGVLAWSMFPGTAWAAPSVFPTGLTINEPGLATPGVVIFSGPDGIVRAIDTGGQLLISWASPDGPDTQLEYARPLPNGNILTRVGPDDTKIVELDKAGNVVFEYEDTEGRHLHHDHQKLQNGNYLLLCSLLIDVPSISDQLLEDDCLVEIDAGGNIVWTWQTADHFDDFDFTEERKQQIFDEGGDWAHANSAYAIPINTSHTDPRFRPGNIIISYRFINQVVIVDRDTGDIVWRSDALTIGQHDAQMLVDGLPGGSNILIFDNGYGGHYISTNIEAPRYWSRIVEVDPATNTIVWEYSAADSQRPLWTFFSWFISSAQRLPNGNTFIVDGAFGRMFEVMPNGRIIWEFINPITDSENTRFPNTNQLYRAEKVPISWL